MRSWRELVAVIGAVAILVLTLGMTSLRSESARRTLCQANLREIYRAEQQYEEEHGSIPPLYIEQLPSWIFWHSFVAPLVNDVRVFACPSDPRSAYLFEENTSPLFSGTVALTSCYGMNRFLLAAGAQKAHAPAARLKYLQQPSHTVVFMDSLRPFVTPDLLWGDKRNFRHDQKANYIFADGAVKHLDQGFFGTFEGDKFLTDFSRWHWR